MKRLLVTLAILIPFLGFSQHPNEWIIGKTIERTEAYLAVIRDDSATIGKDYLIQSMYMQAIGADRMDSVKFMYFGAGGTLIEDDGIYDKVSQVLDMSDFENHGTQTVTANKPYVSGNIAPSTNQGMKNPNGDIRYITHSKISFAADEAWATTTVLNWNDTHELNSTIFSNNISGSCVLRIKQTLYNFVFISSSGSVGSGSAGANNKLIGKNKILTVVAAGDGTLDMYIDGVLIETITATSTDFDFAQIIRERNTAINVYSGTISAHIIRAEALTASQVLAEANFLQEIYPEIPSVTIDGYTVSVSNLEQVASSDGTVITDGSDQTTWATNAAAYWCYHTDTETGSVLGKLYNKQARDVIVANPPSGWHVATEVELAALATNGGNNLKLEGSDYWTTSDGKNLTGFSAIGGASRNADGTFNTIKNTATFWCADSDNVLLLNHNDNTATITTTISAQGHSIRLVKN